MAGWLKTAFISIGAFVLFLVLLFVCFAFFIGMPQDKEASQASADYAKRLATTWDYKSIDPIIDQQMRQAAPEQKTEQILGICKERVGALVSVGTPEGTSNDYFNTNTMSLEVTATYTMNVKFKKGDGTIWFRLSKHDGKWWILAFNVNSPLFLDVPRAGVTPTVVPVALTISTQKS